MEQLTEELSDKQHKAIMELLQQPNVSRAAEAAGVGRSTLYGWMRDPVFAEAYREARREALQQATARLQALASSFVATLEDVSGNSNAPAASRVAAAKAGLEFAYRADMYEDLEQMIQELQEGSEDERR